MLIYMVSEREEVTMILIGNLRVKITKDLFKLTQIHDWMKNRHQSLPSVYLKATASKKVKAGIKLLIAEPSVGEP